MNRFELDAELHERLRVIRAGVRRLFEQLRLRGNDGDVSGKERLERVPALQKRNFANLTGDGVDLAVKEAWRLVDFLEGAEEARLSNRAREALRIVELENQLAASRASDEWKETAARLREALGGFPTSPGISAAVPDGPASDNQPTAPKEGGTIAGWGAKQRRWSIALAAGILTFAALAVSVRIWIEGRSPDSARSCLALEAASVADVAAHRTLFAPPRVAGTPTRPSGEVRTVTARDGTHVASTWTSSYFSNEEPRSRAGKGGGQSDVRLRVGGWGDTYVSLIRFDLPDDRLANRATLQLIPMGSTESFRPTRMILRAIDSPWAVPAGANHRLWWANCPLSEATITNLPPPGHPGSRYRIDITHLYNNWVSGQQRNYGIMLEPEHIGRTGDQAVFNTFHSSRASNEANRPQIIVEY
jgi:hypothetical protein